MNFWESIGIPNVAKVENAPVSGVKGEAVRHRSLANGEPLASLLQLNWKRTKNKGFDEVFVLKNGISSYHAVRLIR